MAMGGTDVQTASFVIEAVVEPSLNPMSVLQFFSTVTKVLIEVCGLAKNRVCKQQTVVTYIE